jgi:hypothetical protein
LTQSLPILERAGEALIRALPDAPRIALRRSWRAQKERRRLARADLTVIAHPKSGSTWLRFQLARLYQRKYSLAESVIPKVEILHRINAEIPRLHMAGYEYIKQVIARPAPDKELAHKALVFLLRHPLDVVVSLYFHIKKHAHPERKLVNDWPLDLSQVSIFDFALNSPWGLREAIRFYNGCLSHAGAMERSLVISYEDMRRKPGAVLFNVAAFAGCEISSADAEEAAEFTSFDRLRQAEITNTFNSPRLRATDPGDRDSFKVRRAKVFGYRDYFSESELKRLEAIVWNELDIRAGYRLPKEPGDARPSQRQQEPYTHDLSAD